MRGTRTALRSPHFTVTHIPRRGGSRRRHAVACLSTWCTYLRRPTVCRDCCLLLSSVALRHSLGRHSEGAPLSALTGSSSLNWLRLSYRRPAYIAIAPYRFAFRNAPLQVFFQIPRVRRLQRRKRFYLFRWFDGPIKPRRKRNRSERRLFAIFTFSFLTRLSFAGELHQ